jgi:transcriptional regulator with XRE-family HTH domain
MIAQKIMHVRREKKISEKQLAKGIEMSITGLRQAMAHDDFKVSILKRVSLYLGVSLRYLIDDNIDISQTNMVTAPVVQKQHPAQEITKLLINRELDKADDKEIELLLKQKNDIIIDLKYTIDSLKSSIAVKNEMIEFLNEKLQKQ